MEEINARKFKKKKRTKLLSLSFLLIFSRAIFLTFINFQLVTVLYRGIKSLFKAWYVLVYRDGLLTGQILDPATTNQPAENTMFEARTVRWH